MNKLKNTSKSLEIVSEIKYHGVSDTLAKQIDLFLIQNTQIRIL